MEIIKRASIIKEGKIIDNNFEKRTKEIVKEIIKIQKMRVIVIIVINTWIREGKKKKNPQLWEAKKITKRMNTK